MWLPHKARSLLIVPALLCALLAGGAVRIVQDQCGPFTDVTPALCPYVLEIYYLGITAGTSATTYSPDNPMTRGQAAVFLSKGINQVLARSSRRAALGQWWTTTPHWDIGLGTTDLSLAAREVACDGSDLWVSGGSVVYRVRASDGKLLETWTGATGARGIAVAMGRVFVVGSTSGARPSTTTGVLYMIDPSQTAGPVTTVATDLGDNALAIAFDGVRFWVTNPLAPGSSSIAIITPGAAPPWSVTTVTTGFSLPFGVLYDGNNVWVGDVSLGALLKLDATGAILQSVPVPTPQYAVFDGANIWVASGTDSIMLIRAATGTVTATLTGNGLANPYFLAFDGERVLVTNSNGDSVSVWQATDLAALGTFSSGGGSLPYGACSDGVNFWVVLSGTGQLARF